MKLIKIIALSLVLVMLLSFAVACSGNDATTTTTTGETTPVDPSQGGEGTTDPVEGDDEEEVVEMVSVTYYNLDGTVYQSSEVVKGEKSPLAEAPQLKAKKFEGWQPEGTEVLLPSGATYTMVKDMVFKPVYSDVIPVEPAKYESNFTLQTGELKTIYINPYVLNKSVPIVLTFKYAQKGMAKGHQNCILRINGQDTLKLTSGYANMVLDPNDSQLPVGGQGWWSYKGDNYPDTTVDTRVTINAAAGTVKFEIGYNLNDVKYSANIKLDGLGNRIRLDFGHDATPELTIKDFGISYTTEDGVVVNATDGGGGGGWTPDFG